MPSSMLAPNALRSLLAGLVDDASLYPPAALPMPESLRAHGHHRASPLAFMQGRFVVAASRLPELLAARDPAMPLRLSVILDVPAGADAVGGALERLAALAVLDGEQTVVADAFEVRLGATMPDLLRARALVAALAHRAEACGDVGVWFEPPYDGRWAMPPCETLPALAALNAQSDRVTVGAKMRTGGPTPNAVPSCEDVAAFIVAAQHARVAWKATAGLHHPVRHLDRASGAPMHGFLNVFTAAFALHAGVADAADVAAIVAEEDPRAFVLDALHLAWRDRALDATTIEAARVFATSFGSCSFSEPIDDLRHLGMLA